jgi:hypothetical protein
MHPGYSWFYNRLNVYEWLGFDRFIHLGDFDEEKDMAGNYISDAAMTDKLLETYEEYTGGGGGHDGKPLFCFTVSIQNHGPYDAGWMYGEIPKNYAAAPGIELSEKSDYALTNYIRGLSDADRSLGRLKNYFEQSARPVVLVFFGDHLPSLGYNFQAYRELQYPIGPMDDASLDLSGKLNTYEEKYLIWANEAARGQWDDYASLARTPRHMSANYLGFYVLDKLGVEHSPYQNFVMSLHDKLPVYGRFYFSEDEWDGEGLAEGAPEALGNELGEYGIVQYYKMFDEDIADASP